MYQPEYSNFVVEELDRLFNGNEAEKQRYRNAMTAVDKVMSDPINREFAKNLPDNYKAVDVLQQYRLYFKIINNPGNDGIDVVYFAWINDEQSLHQTGAGTDSYAVFRDLFNRGEIQGHQPQQQQHTTQTYFRHDPWTRNVVYVSLNRMANPGNISSGSYSTLILNQVTANDFRIDTITVTTEDKGLASALLEGLCAEADRDRVTLNYELMQALANYGKSRHLLEKFDFKWQEDEDSLELWVRDPKAS